MLLCFCFSIFSINCFAVDELDEEFMSVDDNSVMLLADDGYTISAGSAFGFSNSALKNSSFIFLEDLPYAVNSYIIGFNRIGTNYSYFFILDSSVKTLFGVDTDSNGKVRATISSYSPIYRVAYNLSTGSFATMNGYKGLAMSGSASDTNNVLYSFQYSLSAGDYYCSVTRNDSLVIYSSGGLDVSSNFSYGSYPSRESYLNDLNEEQNSILQEQNSILDDQNSLIEEGNETSKGIWETLKGIPEAISDKIKSLFVPDEGFFDTYTTEFQDYFSDRFGLLYELPEAGVNILQQFIDYKPVTDGYYIPVPEVVFPVTLEDGTVKDFVILEKQNYVFDFLSEGVIGTVYKFYRAFCWLVAILSLIALAVRKYNKITGGG